MEFVSFETIDICYAQIWSLETETEKLPENQEKKRSDILILNERSVFFLI